MNATGSLDEHITVSSWCIDCSDMNSSAAIVRVTRRLLLEAAARFGLTMPDVLTPCTVEPTFLAQPGTMSCDVVSGISGAQSAAANPEALHNASIAFDQKWWSDLSLAASNRAARSIDVAELTGGLATGSTCTDSSSQSWRMGVHSTHMHPEAVLTTTAAVGPQMQVVCDLLSHYPYHLPSPATPRLFREKGEPLLRYYQMPTPSHHVRENSSPDSNDA